MPPRRRTATSNFGVGRRESHVADAFYAALRTSDGSIDTRQAAQALHHAIRRIRDELPASPSLWAAYVHAGA